MVPSAIAWLEWGPDAFAQAQREDKPILLRISATWCHWCHVMDGTSDQEPDALRTIHERFVPVRIDTDRLPDVNERYNMGGWPTTVFLTPQGDVLHGETYIPPERFAGLLKEVDRVWREQKGDVTRQVEEHARRHGDREPQPPGTADADAVLERVAEAAVSNFDPQNGGWGTAPKFPHPDALDFCFVAAELGDREELDKIARRTLDKMGSSELWDREELGFFRYGTRHDWGRPHFEKMLESNARLLQAYAFAYLKWKEPNHREIVEGILAYARANLRTKDGTYGHSQDADEEYYALPLDDRKDRTSPPVDLTVCTNYNASFASGLFRAAAALERWDLVAEGEAILRWIRDRMWDTSRGLAHYWDGSPHVLNLLDDHAHLLRALIEAYEATGSRGYLRWFDDLAKQTERILLTESGAYRDRPLDPGALGRLREARTPLAANGVLAQAFVRYARLTGETRYAKAAQAVLDSLASSYSAYGLFASDYAVAALMSAREPVLLTVIAPADGARDLHRAALRVARPWRVVEVLRRGEHDKELEARGYGGIEGPALLPCVGRTCGAPVGRPDLVTAAVDALAARP